MGYDENEIEIEIHCGAWQITTKNREPGAKTESAFFFRNGLLIEQNDEFQKWVAASWVSDESPRVSTSSFAGNIQDAFYGFDIARMLEGHMAELLFGNIGWGFRLLLTFVRNDNSTVLYPVDSVGEVANGERLSNFSGSNREELEKITG